METPNSLKIEKNKVDKQEKWLVLIELAYWAQDSQYGKINQILLTYSSEIGKTR
jgi:hypothetical protein